MDQKPIKNVAETLRSLHLPRYEELPDAGLFLEQTSRYIESYLTPLPDVTLTGSMISNYVKKHLIDKPVRKQYNRSQIAHLLFIAVAKRVLTLEEIQLIFQVQKRTYSDAVAYDYFCAEFENVLQFVFGLKPVLDEIGHERSYEKRMLRNIIIAAAHRIYLTNCFASYMEYPEHTGKNTEHD